MATDGLVTNGNEVVTDFDYPKALRLKDGSIVAVAGMFFALEALRAFLDGDAKEVEAAGEWDAIRLMPDGSGLFYCDKHPTLGAPCSWPATLGTGGEIALGAMLAGATPKKAVELACERDCGSGGKITVLALGK